MTRPALVEPVAWNPEHALVGALIQGDTAAIATAAEEVSPADFTDVRAGAVYEAILALDGAGKPVDVVTVAEVLKSMGKLAEAGGPAFLSNLPDALGLAPIQEYARIIREKGARRQLRRMCGEVADLAKSEEVDLPTLLETAGEKFQSVLLQRTRAAFRPMTALVEDTLSMLDAMKHGGGLLGLGTGFPDVDRVVAGLEAGDLAVLAARPGVGKTSFALQVAEYQAIERRVPVAVLSLEMPARQLVLRLAAGRARVPLEKVRRGRLSPIDEERLAEAMQALYDAPIHIDDSADVSALDVRSKVRRLKQQHPALGLLVVDYLQLLRPRARAESRQVEVAEMSRALKQAAKELELPVLALSQLNRKVEERKGPPQLSDLRESGAIEQDADIVLFLHREKAEEEDGESGAPEAAVVELHVAKQRNGPLGQASLVFLGPYTRFESAVR